MPLLKLMFQQKKISNLIATPVVRQVRKAKDLVIKDCLVASCNKTDGLISSLITLNSVIYLT